MVYRQEFIDILGLHWRVLIGDTSGSPEYYDFTNTGDPLRIDFLKTSSDLFTNPIKGSLSYISVYADDHFEFLEISSHGDLNIPVVISYKEDGDFITYWRGFVAPNTYQEAYDGISYPVTITANDGLGLLKEFYINTLDYEPDISWSGRKTASEIILTILALIGVDEFTEYINIYEENMDSDTDDSPFTQEYIDSKVFDEMSCYDALAEILKKFNAEIRQYKGKLIIYRPIDLHKTTIKGRVISDGSVIQASDLEPEQMISRSGAITDLRDVEGGYLMQISPDKEIKFTQDYGYVDSLLLNWDFKIDKFKEDFWEGWTDPVKPLESIGRPISETLEDEEDEGVIIIPTSEIVSSNNLRQIIYDVLSSSKDVLELSFDYGYYNPTTSTISTSTGVGIYVSAYDGVNNRYLRFDTDENVLKWSSNSSDKVRLYTNINADPGFSGWNHFSGIATSGVPLNADYYFNLQNFVKSDGVYMCYKNVRFRLRSSRLATMRKKRKLFQRLRASSSGGGLNFDIRPKYYKVSYREAVDPATEFTFSRFNDITGYRSEFDFILGDVIDLDTPPGEGNVDMDNILLSFRGALGVMDGSLMIPSSSWTINNPDSADNLLILIADEIRKNKERVKQMISLPVKENSLTSILPQINLIGNFQDSLNKYESNNRIFVFLGGEFIVREREWNLELIELIVLWPPEAPSGLTLTALESTLIGGIKIEWTDNSSNEDGFRVEFKKVAYSEWNFYKTSPDAELYNATLLTVNTQYDVRVRAFNAAGDSSWITGQIYTRLSTPTATAGSSVTTSSFVANWDSVTGASSYRLDVSANSSFSSFVSEYENLTVSGTSQSVTGLSADTNYYYRVRAVNDNSTSYNSNTITQKTAANSPPDTPTGLTAENDGSQGLNLSWNSSAGATYYEYQYNVNGGSYTSWINNENSTNAYISGFTDNDNVCVRVKACNTNGCSFQSSAVCTVIGAPT